MGSAASVKKGTPVQLAVSDLGGMSGCRAHHTSIFIGEDELSFSEAGIDILRGGGSHGDRPSKQFAMGTAQRSAQQLRDELSSHFLPGTYDLLRKNCNSFSDAAL